MRCVGSCSANGFMSPMHSDRIKLLLFSQKTFTVLSAMPVTNRLPVTDKSVQFTCLLALRRLMEPIEGRFFSDNLA